MTVELSSFVDVQPACKYAVTQDDFTTTWIDVVETDSGLFATNACYLARASMVWDAGVRIEGRYEKEKAGKLIRSGSTHRDAISLESVVHMINPIKRLTIGLSRHHARCLMPEDSKSDPVVVLWTNGREESYVNLRYLAMVCGEVSGNRQALHYGVVQIIQGNLQVWGEGGNKPVLVKDNNGGVRGVIAAVKPGK